MRIRELFVLVTIMLYGCQDMVEMLPFEESQGDESYDYYWCNGVKFPLTKDDSKSYVVMDSEKLESFRNSTTCVIKGVKALNNYSAAGVKPSKVRESKIDLVSFIMDNTSKANVNPDDIIYEAPYFKADDGSEIGITNFLSVRLKKGLNIETLYEKVEEFNLEFLGENEHDPSIQILICTKDSKGNALEMANFFYESGICEYATPGFIVEYKALSNFNDPYFSQQWGLQNVNNPEMDINLIDEVGSYISPYLQNVIVAVVDNGIYSNHDDLPLHSWSYDEHTQTYPSVLYGDHGTAVAGIIGATANNNIGISGVASGVKILPISICYADDADRLGLESASNTEHFANAIRFAANNGARIINNSWSYIFPTPIPEIYEAIQYAQAKGCIVVFASGNNNGTVSQPAVGASSETVVVGAMNPSGLRSPFSNYGTSLDFVAPGSDIWTTTWTGGYDIYSGTSFAAPHVSAIAALMLAANPSLSNHDVCRILELTARKLPSYTFPIIAGRPNGGWNNEVGYGLVDCYNAVRVAANYSAYNEDNHNSLIEFDYSGTEISMRLKVEEDITIFWDSGTLDISHICADSVPYVDTTITHTYSTSGIHHIMIGEQKLSADVIPRPSAALTEFDLITGLYASNLEFNNINSALRYIKIVGGAMFEPQTITIRDLYALEELYLARLSNADVAISNCYELETISTSEFDLPTVPESVCAPRNLNISNCSSITKLILENVYFPSYGFGSFPNLNYLYLSSYNSGIVGATNIFSQPQNKGYYLSSSLATLPVRSGMSGTVVIRAVNNTNTSYIPVQIGSQYKTAIENNCSNKGWDVIWDSGVTVL